MENWQARQARRRPAQRKANHRKRKPGGVSEGQERKVWALMYRLAAASPSTVAVGDRLRAAIKKEAGVDAFADDPFAWLDYKSCNKLIEALRDTSKTRSERRVLRMDEKLPEWLEQCLTEDDRQLIGIVGTEAFLRLIDTYGGGNVYIPKNDRFERYARNKAIVAEFDGYNFRELAQKYHLTEMQIRVIVKDKAAAVRAKPVDGQMSLFDAPDEQNTDK